MDMVAVESVLQSIAIAKAFCLVGISIGIITLIAIIYYIYKNHKKL